MIHAATAAVAFLASAGLIATLLPWLRRKALAHMTHRSSHVVPTPQGAGIVVVAVTLVASCVLIADGVLPAGADWVAMGTGAALLCVIGFGDDMGGLPIAIRFLGQTAAVLAVIIWVPTHLRVLPEPIPLTVERAALGFAALWFVNLFNFMDGIDWISFLEVSTVAGGVAILALFGLAPPAAGGTALALVAAMGGFAVWNRPRASVFLGDAGSLPIGLILAWLMVDTAAHGKWAAVLLFSLYYWADATVTLLRRMLRGEQFWQGHREHFYQQATRVGRLGVPRTLLSIAITNIALVLLGVAAELIGGDRVKFAALVAGIFLVAGLLWHLRDGTRASRR